MLKSPMGRSTGLVPRQRAASTRPLLRAKRNVCRELSLSLRAHAAGPLSPVSADARIHQKKRSQLDRLYQRVVDDLDTLVRAVVSKPHDNGAKREQNLSPL